MAASVNIFTYVVRPSNIHYESLLARTVVLAEWIISFDSKFQIE